MSRPSFGAVLLCCTFLPLARAQEPAGKDVFGATKVWAIHLEIAAKEYEAMQPPAAGFGFPGAPPAPVPKEPAEKRDSARNLFGTEFRWARGDFTAGDETWKGVGLRYSGEITY